MSRVRFSDGQKSGQFTIAPVIPVNFFNAVKNSSHILFTHAIEETLELSGELTGIFWGFLVLSLDVPQMRRNIASTC